MNLPEPNKITATWSQLSWSMQERLKAAAKRLGIAGEAYEAQAQLVREDLINTTAQRHN